MAPKTAPRPPCTNCTAPAKYTLSDTVNTVHYCDACLPTHFQASAAAGDLPLTG